jgi:hypothetical protein
VVTREQQRLPVGRIARLELALSHNRAGLGVSFRPGLKFFDKTARRIRPIPFRWVSEDNNVAMVDEDLMIINTFSYGRTSIHAETLDGKVKSKAVPLEVVRINRIDISPTEIEIDAGTRHKLDAVCTLNSSEQTSDLYLLWTESNSTVARVSSSGLLYGFAPGTTEVVAGDDKCLSRKPCLVTVVAGEGRGSGEDARGRGFPLVKVSGEIDLDPVTKEYVNFSREEPPVAQRPQDVERNIWWINSAAPMAKLYLDTTKGYGYETREWRMYHLERYIDVIVQIALIHGPDEKENLSATEWILRRGFREAEIQTAAASDLRDFIATGILPGE